MRRPLAIFSSILLTAAALAGPANANGTLDRVRDGGLLRCGVVPSGIGVSEADESGTWTGFFPDFCRALAAAITGDADAVEFVEVNYVTRFEALNAGAFDVLMANTTWTTTRDTDLDLAFTEPIFYDGQGFLAHRSLGAARLGDVRKATVCVSENTTTIKTLRELIASRYPSLEIKPYESIEIVYDSFFAHECDLMTQDRVALVSQRLSRAADPDAFVLFPDVVSKEPLGPAVRAGDEDWFDVVQWAVFATIIAEEHGITSENVEGFRTSSNPEIRRLLGEEAGIGKMLGLPETWAFEAIRQVGNYGEIYERSLGAQSAMGMERGLNALWTNGGLIYAPPLR